MRFFKIEIWHILERCLVLPEASIPQWHFPNRKSANYHPLYCLRTRISNIWNTKVAGGRIWASSLSVNHCRLGRTTNLPNSLWRWGHLMWPGDLGFDHRLVSKGANLRRPGGWNLHTTSEVGVVKFGGDSTAVSALLTKTRWKTDNIPPSPISARVKDIVRFHQLAKSAIMKLKNTVSEKDSHTPRASAYHLAFQRKWLYIYPN